VLPAKDCNVVSASHLDKFRSSNDVHPANDCRDVSDAHPDKFRFFNVGHPTNDVSAEQSDRFKAVRDEND
jgi:hypothetical protein